MDSLSSQAPQMVELGVHDLIEAEVRARFDVLTQDPSKKNERVIALAKELHQSIQSIGTGQPVRLTTPGAPASFEVTDDKPLYYSPASGYTNFPAKDSKLVSEGSIFKPGVVKDGHFAPIDFAAKQPTVPNGKKPTVFNPSYVELVVRKLLAKCVDEHAALADKNGSAGERRSDRWEIKAAMLDR